MKCLKERSARKEKKKKINCGNQVVKIEERKNELWEEKEKIVATKLPKLQGRIKK